MFSGELLQPETITPADGDRQRADEVCLKRVERDVQQLFHYLSNRFSSEEMLCVKRAYEWAKKAHAGQRRKTGEPYIMHPVAVARIVAVEFMMDAGSVAAAFLHDIVEDTPCTVEELRAAFGEDVAFLVKVVTKPKYREEGSGNDDKQENNFRQLLDSMRHDIRAVLVKLADRLHNMRTLGSMLPVKQMKIGGETDFFYAPFANRLGLHNLRRELENLSFRFRCGDRYERLRGLLVADREANEARLGEFTTALEQILSEAGIPVRTEIRYRLPYSIDRRMHKAGCDFAHVAHRYVVRVIYDPEKLREDGALPYDKTICLRIYGLLTGVFQEKAGSLINYLDHPKENGYQSLHIQLLSERGIWEEIHISSEEMVRRTRLGVMLHQIERERNDMQGVGINRLLDEEDRTWIDKFCRLLSHLAENDGDMQFMEGVASSLYAEDITVYAIDGTALRLPHQATALDFAFERGEGEQALYARIDGSLSSLKATLEHGCCVEIFTSPDAHPQADWLSVVKTYKAKHFLKCYLRNLEQSRPCRCPVCAPLPGQEVIGFSGGCADQQVMIHRRDCPVAISWSAQRGDSIVEVNFPANAGIVYPVRTRIRAINRRGLLHDIINSLTVGLQLDIDHLQAETTDNIVECTLYYNVHSADELRSAVRFLGAVDGVDEVYKI